MQQTLPFGEVVDAADKLSEDEQQALVDLLHRRLAEHRRKALVADIQQARQEFQEGRCQPATLDDLMKEILS